MTLLPTLRRLAAPALAALAVSAAFGAHAGEAEIRKSLAAIP